MNKQTGDPLKDVQIRESSITAQSGTERTALGGFCLSILVTIAVALASYRISEHQLEAARQVSRAQKVIARLANVRGTLVDLETGARGYVITGRTSYLEPHNSALARFDSELGELRRQVSDPRQLSRLLDLEKAARPRFETSWQIVATRRTQGLAAAQKLFDSDVPHQQMNFLRGILNELKQEERKILVARTKAEASAVKNFWASMAALIAILLVAESAIYLTVRRNNARRGVLLRTLAGNEEVLSRFRAALDIAPGAVFLTDATTMRIIDTNEMACRMTGYGRAELLAMVTSELFVATSSEKLREAYAALMSGKVAEQVFEALARRKDGSEYPVEVTRRHLRVGDTQLIVGVARDVSERNEIQKQLRDNQDNLAAALAETSQRNREITTLADLGEVLQSCTSPDESYAPIARFCGLLFPDGSGALFLMHNSRNYLESVAKWGGTLGSKDVFAPAECWALRRGQFHRLDNAAGLRCPHLETSAGGGRCARLRTPNRIGRYLGRAPRGIGETVGAGRVL